MENLWDQDALTMLDRSHVAPEGFAYRQICLSNCVMVCSNLVGLMHRQNFHLDPSTLAHFEQTLVPKVLRGNKISVKADI